MVDTSHDENSMYKALAISYRTAGVYMQYRVAVKWPVIMNSCNFNLLVSYANLGPQVAQ
jgi:hypothetical protein